jgi:hypothetical protein
MKKGIYKYYKGNEYKVIALGRIEETLESAVVYQALAGDQDIWVRTQKNFQETVEIDGSQQPRFEFVRNN